MKKIILALTTVIITFCTPNVFAVIGPIPVDESNTLPDGYIYAEVIVETHANFCSGGTLDGITITAYPNEAILIPGSNYGIQEFGFNYDGDAATLEITILNDPGGDWGIDLSGTVDGFGVFLYDTSGTGSTRMNPLELSICEGIDLLEEDFVTPNGNGYTFAAHIADFTFNAEPGYDDTESAFFATMETTLIELSNFEAIPGNREVVIHWDTASEIDNTGFNIYRADQEDGAYLRINAALIQAQGSPTQGARYEFVDDDVKNRNAYYYLLEDIDFNGVATEHGPVRATPRLLYNRKK